MSALVFPYSFSWKAVMDSANLVRERMFKDLTENERLLKEAALQVVQGFHPVCFFTAQRLDSQRVQMCCGSTR